VPVVLLQVGNEEGMIRQMLPEDVEQAGLACLPQAENEYVLASGECAADLASRSCRPKKNRSSMSAFRVSKKLSRLR